jgi:hypothetical protein
MNYDENRPYYSPDPFVYVGGLALELSALWDGLDAAEARGVSLDEIALALASNWSATVVALSLETIACLRSLIDEARRP